MCLISVEASEMTLSVDVLFVLLVTAADENVSLAPESTKEGNKRLLTRLPLEFRGTSVLILRSITQAICFQCDDQ